MNWNRIRFCSALLILLGALSAELSAKLPFLVIGDWGRDGKHGQRETAMAMAHEAERQGARFVIGVGDNFYENGVSSTEDPQWVSTFDNIYTSPSLQIPWYMVLGNHDYLGNSQAQVDKTTSSARWRMPARFYTWLENAGDGETVQFFALDTNALVERYRASPQKYPGLADQDVSGQLTWLEQSLASSNARWKIVFGHHPVYSHGKQHGDCAEMIRLIRPLLERHHVQIYFAGHDHDLQDLRDETSVHYVISGAGSEVRGTGIGVRTQWANGDTSGFVSACIEGRRMTIRFISMKGENLHTFSFDR